MAILYTAQEYVDKLIDIYNTYTVKSPSQTIYGFTDYRWGKWYDNKFHFDCVMLLKCVFWGWNGDKTAEHGGAIYESHGVSDFSLESSSIKYDVSTDFSNISIGEYLYMPGHCGIYIGNGQHLECCAGQTMNIRIAPLSAQPWVNHGKLIWLSYDSPGPTTYYTLSFNANGGSGSMSSRQVKASTLYTLPSCSFTPPQGKKFKGWSKTSSGSSIISTITLTSNTTVYAIWENDTPVTTYTLTLDANDGSGRTESRQVSQGQHNTSEWNCPFTSPTGKEFIGWGISKTSVSPTIIMDGNKTLYAIWDWKELSIIYHSNNGDEESDFEITKYGQNYTIMSPPSSFVPPPNKKFGSWNTKTDGSGEKRVPGDIITPTANKIFYAQWIDTLISHIYVGHEKMIKGYIGNKKIKKIYIGNNLVFKSEE